MFDLANDTDHENCAGCGKIIDTEQAWFNDDDLGKFYNFEFGFRYLCDKCHDKLV